MDKADDLGQLEQEERQKLCQGRCNYIFQPTKQTKTQVTIGEVGVEVTERVDEAILFCTVCTATCDRLFQYPADEKVE